MLTVAQVETMIRNILPCDFLEVEGDGHHFFAKIVSSAFEGKARLARHRMIKDALAQKISDNSLHALSLSVTATPAEWANRQASQGRS